MAQRAGALSGIRGLLRRKAVVPALVLAIAPLLLYLPVIHHRFIHGWDDNVYITDNPHVRTGLTVANLAWAFTTRSPYYWQPLTQLSHMVDCQLFGLNPGPHFYVNVILHAANTVLLFLLLYSATGAVWRSFLVGALFGVHPINVETVAWAAERGNLMEAFFVLLAIALYGWYLRRSGWKRYLIVVAGFVLAIMAKPTAVVFPVILLFLDYWPLRRQEDLPPAKRWGRLLFEKLPLFAISAAASLLTVSSESAAGSVIPFSVLPLSTRLENAVISYAAYIREFLIPVKLSPFYPYLAAVGHAYPVKEGLLSAIVLLAITAVVLHFRSAHFAAAGWFLYLVTLMPAIGIIQSGPMARQDHFLYVPAVGLYILTVWGVAALFETAPISKPALLATALCFLAGYAFTTSQYLQSWQNAVTLFGRARVTAGQPDPWIEQHYADALLEAGRSDEALQHYRQSCALWPGNVYCHFSIAEILFDRHEYIGAVREYRAALGLANQPPLAVYCLNKSAEALLRAGNIDAAQNALATALRIDPADPVARKLQMQLLARQP